jgi:signal transduction histidine kinase/DNA-binding response OmpR family regulator
MIKKVLLTITFGCISLTLLSQLSKVDSLKKVLNVSPKQDTTKVNVLNELSYQFIGIDYYEARNLAQQALDLAKTLSYSKGICIARSRLSLCYWILGDGELAIRHANDAIDQMKTDKLDIGLLADTYRVLGVTYIDQSEFDKAQHYLEEAEKICLQKKNWSILLRVYIGMGTVQLEKNRVDSALFLFQKSRALENDHPNQYYLPVIYTQIGSIYGTPKYDNSKTEIEYYTKALTISEEVQNRYAKSRVLLRLGNVFIRLKNYTLAEKNLLESQSIARKIGLKTVVRDTYLQLMKLKMIQGQYPQSLHYQKAYYDLRDSLNNEKKTRLIVELETLYEREKRQQEIKLLIAQKKNSQVLQNSLLLGIIFLLLFGVIIYTLQRQRNKKATQLLHLQKKINDTLKEADQLKSHLFANISHEFRTPLTLIIAPVEDRLSLPGKLGIDHKSSELVLRNAKRLLTLVNQLLDLSKLEAKKMKLNHDLDNLETFLQIISASFESLAHQKKINFKYSLNLQHTEFEFDSDKLEKIITNVLMNSFKFTKTGGTVTLTVNELVQEKQLIVVVSDTGIGIPEEDKKNIFSPFYRSREATNGDIGTGLGLSLVKELVKLYEGNIDLQSTINQGTTITITLPISSSEPLRTIMPFKLDLSQNSVEMLTQDQQGSTLDKDKKSDKQRILVVEDNLDLQKYLESLLNKQYNVIVAHDGKEGIEYAFQHTPDIIVSDVMMPNINGIDLTEKLKHDERTNHIPIILLTAKVDLASRIDGLKVGADDYLAKPFAPEELSVRISNLLEQRKKLAEKYMKSISTATSPALINSISMDEKFLRKAKDIVTHHISDHLFGVEQMAERMNLSRAQLFRKLKAISGLSPNEFINDIRLLHAAELIRAKADTLAQICYSVGFNEQSYFAKRFKKKFGVNPSEYQ